MTNQDKKPTEKEAAISTGNMLTEKPTSFDIDVKSKGWFHKLRMRLKLAPTINHFEIKPQRVVNVHRIALRRQRIDEGDFLNNIDRIGTMNRIMANNADDIYYIVATAIQNDHREPTQSMIDIVKNDFEMPDLYNVMFIAVSNYDLTAFINTIALITGISD